MELKDTGTGILPQLRPRIFEPFVTSGKERGTGLGLAIVREIVEGHGGTIRVQSWLPGEEEGQEPGSVFRIRMPSGPPSAPEIPE
jgi:two-component system sensor histidine kinase MprB